MRPCGPAWFPLVALESSYNELTVLAAKERTDELSFLAAGRVSERSGSLPETRVRGLPAGNHAGVGGCWPVTSTLVWGCGYSCDGTASGSLDQYYYAPDGKRFWRLLAEGGSAFTLRGAHGEQLGSGALQSVYFAGRLIWQGNPSLGSNYTQYPGLGGWVTPDRLGTNLNSGSGPLYPYGDASGQGLDRVEFATYTRDSYTGFDYADQRFYASTYGRFLTPDRKGGNRANPGSLNRYAYVLGDPVNRNDPRGLCSVFIGGFTTNYNTSAAFTQAGSAVGADLAYPYSFPSGAVGFAESIAVWQGNVATDTALMAIEYALQSNSGAVDIVAFSGGAHAFTNAYNLLSPSQQQRIGNIVYVSPGTLDELATNGSTSAVLGAGLDPGNIFSGSLTYIPTSVPLTDTTCAHSDFACFIQQAQAQFAPIQNDGSCNAPQVFTRATTQNILNMAAAASQQQQVSSWWQNVSNYMPGLADAFLDWVDSIPVGGPDFTVDETITYP